jgi:hypothetical protein
MNYLFSLGHVSNDTVSEYQENKITGAISVCAGKASHMIYNRREVGGSRQLNLMDAVPVSF